MDVVGTSKCRACLQEHQNMKLLTAEYLICGELLAISKIITTCTSIQIKIDDENYPRYICETCLQDANISYTFRKRCEQSENILKTSLEEKRTKNIHYLKNVCEQTESYVNFGSSQCIKSPEKFVSHRKLDRRTISEYSKNKKYSCTFCTKYFNSKKRLNKHLIIHSSNTLRAMRKSARQSKLKDETSSNSDHNYSDNETPATEIKNELNETNFVDIKSKFILLSNDLESTSLLSKEISGLEIIKHAKEKNENGVYECLCCNETFDDTLNLRTHMSSHKSYKCKICKKKFTLLSNLRRHLKSHNLKIKSEYDTHATKHIPEFKCIGCDEIFYKRKLLSEHLKTHKEFVCTICGAKFTFATNLRKHLSCHNRSKEKIKVWKQIPVDKRTCDICFKVFKYRPSLLKHRKKHEFTGKKCTYCEIVFENYIKLYKHMDENHEHEKNVVCLQCGKKFFREWNLKMHMIVHSGDKPYMCEICGVSFALGGNLASHKRLHTGVKPYKCDTCGREFTQQAALRSHEAGHSNRRDHICPECGAAFSRAGAMRNHCKRHLATKPFACTMCDKRFTFSSERKRHMAIHTGERNYVCDFCGKAFNRPTNLTVHRRIHTGQLPHKCDICGKGFVQAHCMRTHRNTHTRDVDLEHVSHVTGVVGQDEQDSRKNLQIENILQTEHTGQAVKVEHGRIIDVERLVGSGQT